MRNAKKYYLLLVLLIPLVYLNAASAGNRIGERYTISENGSIVQEYIYDDTSPDVTLDIPDNDDCENAEEVFDMLPEARENHRDDVIQYSTAQATFDGDGLCQTEPNIWYSYTADVTAEVTVSTDGSLGNSDMDLEYDSYLAVYDGGNCPPTSLIACNDDYEEDYYSQITFIATEGNQYLIEVGGIDKGVRPATGTGELIVTVRPIHDVRVWTVINPRPKMLNDEELGFQDIMAYIFNPGTNTERVNITAYDPDGEYYNDYDNLIIAPDELVQIHLVNQNGQYTFPSETCVDGNLIIEAHLERDVVPENNTFEMTFRRPRPVTDAYDDFNEDESGGGAWMYHHDDILAKRYIAEIAGDINYIGARIEYALGNGSQRNWDPGKLYVFLDENDDDIPDDEPVFEAVAQPEGYHQTGIPGVGVFHEWCYAVLPCGISLEIGEDFWVGWSDYQYDRWGHSLGFDNIPTDRTLWFYDHEGGWLKEVVYGHFYLGAWMANSDVALTSINSDGVSGIPETYELSQNYPNPFNAQTSIGFALPQAGDVELRIYNMLGQKIDVMALGQMEAGHHTVNWDASEVSTGVYFYEIQSGEFNKTQKMLLLK